MGRRYSTDGNQNAAAGVTILGLASATTIRPAIYMVHTGSGATPANQAYNMQINRFTAVGTKTAVTPQALDPADPAALAAGAENHTSEPTYTAGAVMMSFGWNLTEMNGITIALPDNGRIVAPATANAGFGMRFVVVSAGTALCEATFHHEE